MRLSVTGDAWVALPTRYVMLSGVDLRVNNVSGSFINRYLDPSRQKWVEMTIFINDL